MPAIATSMIAATGGAVRAAAPPQDQSQAPAGDSPFAILLAALSAQGTPAGEGADTADSPPNDQAGQTGKSAVASEKSNAADHVAEATLAALLNGTAAPAPFSLPAPEAGTTDPVPVTLTDNGKAQPLNAGANPPPDASTRLDPAAPSVTGAPINPARSVPGDGSAMPPPSGDKARSDARITDASTADTSTDPVPFAAANGPAAPLPVSGGKAEPQPKTADASGTDAGLPSKAQPEKNSAAPDQSETSAAPAMIAAAYAGSAGQASTDQSASPAVTADAAQSLSVRATPGIGVKPAKDLTSSGPAVTPSDSDDTDKQAAADMPPEFAGSIGALAAGKAATAPVKSAGVSAKPATNTQTATDAPSSVSPDKLQILSAAHANPGTHVAAAKTDAPSDDNAKLVQADSTANAVPVPAVATTHTAPPPQLVAIVDPSAIMAPHAASASSPGAGPAANLEITRAAADPAPDLNGFAVSIAARSLSGAKQFEIRLDPPELGRVDVRLSIDAAGKAVAHMATDQPQTLDLLRKDAPALTQALRDAGLDVSQNGLNFSLRGQDRQSGDSQGGTQGRKSSLSARLAIRAVQAPAAFAYAGAASSARLDIHV